MENIDERKAAHNAVIYGHANQRYAEEIVEIERRLGIDIHDGLQYLDQIIRMYWEMFEWTNEVGGNFGPRYGDLMVMTMFERYKNAYMAEHGMKPEGP